jgi:hypothetical protein
VARGKRPKQLDDSEGEVLGAKLEFVSRFHRASCAVIRIFENPSMGK